MTNEPTSKPIICDCGDNLNAHSPHGGCHCCMCLLSPQDVVDAWLLNQAAAKFNETFKKSTSQMLADYMLKPSAEAFATKKGPWDELIHDDSLASLSMMADYKNLSHHLQLGEPLDIQKELQKQIMDILRTVQRLTDSGMKISAVEISIQGSPRPAFSFTLVNNKKGE